MENKKVKELKARIEDLEKTLFYIDMIDHWTQEDYQIHDELSKEIKELKTLLAKAVVEG